MINENYNFKYIVNPTFDNVFLIFSPLLTFFVAFIIQNVAFFHYDFQFGVYETSIIEFFLSTYIMAHIVFVFLRTHLNKSVYKQFKLRFTIIPMFILVSITSSLWLLTISGLIVVWWDVYHSGMQTFGLGRIYDARMKNDPLAGRNADKVLNLIFYIGPILSGATLVHHIEQFRMFDRVDSIFFYTLPDKIYLYEIPLRYFFVAFSLAFLAYYFFQHYKLVKNGYKLSFPKIFLYTNTSIVSIFAWGFNSFGAAFFIMNVFHATQYFAIVWFSENKNLSEISLNFLGIDKKFELYIFFLLLAFILGAILTIFGPRVLWVESIGIVCSLMHFWYDGFIWSVSKRQI